MDRQFIEQLLWVIPIAPLAGAVAIGLLCALSPKRGSFPSRPFVGLIACLGPLTSFIIACGIFFTLGKAHDTVSLHQKLYSWITCGAFSIDFAFEADRLTAVMLMFVTFVGTIIHCYSIAYMGHDKGYARFFSYLNLFLSSMLILVLGSNLVLMFLGWEGVGLCSYLLIAFWFDDEAKAIAGKKALSSTASATSDLSSEFFLFLRHCLKMVLRPLSFLFWRLMLIYWPLLQR